MRAGIDLIIGGSASSGSSLLVSKLTCHSQIYSGPETNLFTKQELFTNWEGSKSKLLNHSNKHWYSSCWHVHDGVQLEDLMESEDLSSLLQSVEDFPAFINELFQHCKIVEGKSIAIEKTPSNSVHFPLIREYFPNMPCVLMIRHPYDAIASMMNRGWSVIYAAGLYLYNISYGLSLSEGLHVIKYEGFVDNPESELSAILDLVDQDFEESMLEPSSSGTKIESWYHHPGADIIKDGDTFSKSDPGTKSVIHTAIQGLKFKNGFQSFGVKPLCNNIQEIMDYVGYLTKYESKVYCVHDRTVVKKQLFTHKLKRTIRGYPLGFPNFPFELNWSE